MKNKHGYTVLIVLLCVIAVMLAGILGIGIFRGVKAFSPRGTTPDAQYTLCVDETYDVSLTQVAIDTNYGNIFVKNSTDGMVHLSIFAEEKGVKVTQVGTALNISVRVEDSKHFGSNNFSINNTDQVKITLSLPAGYSGDIAVRSNYGSLEADAFPVAAFNVESDYGSLNIAAVSRLKADCDYGSIHAGEISTYVNIEADYGSIDIDRLTLAEDGEIKCGYGSIRIGSADGILIKAEAKAGSSDIRQNPLSYTATLEVEADAGSIEVK